ncbi:hypothetical protein QU577_26800 [Priestia megaterium]|uniref:hypothetical protein n=1 Tax=Priestia megaterium TaxID=1404 RepID=UPI0025B05A6E|nr:hypothetical protein [Priestia megaterium]MDN3365375.1 hypothetical protein [Priestia megaterium]
MFKKIVIAFTTLGMLFSVSLLGHTEAATSYGSWEFVSKKNAGVTTNQPKLVYTSGMANRTGEVANGTVGKEYTNSISANVGASALKVISAEVGYSFGVTHSRGYEHTSAPLRKGEYAKFYESRTFNVTKVTLQRKVNNGKQCILETKNVYTYKQQLPQITIKYCKKGQKGQEVCY